MKELRVEIHQSRFIFEYEIRVTGFFWDTRITISFPYMSHSRRIRFPAMDRCRKYWSGQSNCQLRHIISTVDAFPFRLSSILWHLLLQEVSPSGSLHPALVDQWDETFLIPPPTDCIKALSCLDRMFFFSEELWIDVFVYCRRHRKFFTLKLLVVYEGQDPTIVHSRNQDHGDTYVFLISTTTSSSTWDTPCPCLSCCDFDFSGSVDVLSKNLCADVFHYLYAVP